MKPEKNSFLVGRIKSVRYALRGLWLLATTEHSIMSQLIISGIMCFVGFYFNLSSTEWMFQILAIGMVLTAEGLNTAIEKLCDYFAKCILAPQCLIISRNEFDINTIVTKYKVSKMVAENWLYAINNRIATFGKDYLTDTEKSYLKQIKKYHNHQPASNGL